MRLTEEQIIEIVQKYPQEELESRLQYAEISELKKAASICAEKYLDGLDKKAIIKIIKKKLITVFRDTPTLYLFHEIYHRIHDAINAGDIDTLSSLKDSIKGINDSLDTGWPGDIEKDSHGWSELLRAKRLREISQAKPKSLRKPNNCPKCGRQRIERIVYGLPAKGDGLYEPDNSDVYYAGCDISGEINDWRCIHCGHEWSDPTDPIRIERVKAREKILAEENEIERKRMVKEGIKRKLNSYKEFKGEEGKKLSTEWQQYRLIHSPLNGNDAIEILKNDQPLWEDQPGLRLSEENVLMLLTCIDELESIAESFSDIPRLGKNVLSDKYYMTCHVRNGICEGELYLQILNLENQSEICVSRKKAEAFINLKDQITLYFGIDSNE